MSRRPPTLTPISTRALLHPVWLGALVVLAVNDHLLKGAGVLPGWLTGKLSDVAGLLVAPLLLAVLARVRTRGGLVAAHVLTGLGFAAIQLSPATAAVYDQLVSLFGVSARTWPDRTDLVALLALWPSWRLGARALRATERDRGLGRRAAALGAVAVGAFFCLATPDETTAPLEPPEDTSAPEVAAPSFCGDGVVDPGEVCDDGNEVAEDGCTRCLLDPPACIDSTRWIEFECGVQGATTVCTELDCGLERADDGCTLAPDAVIRTRVAGRISAGDAGPVVAIEPVGTTCACPGQALGDCEPSCDVVLGVCQPELRPLSVTVEADAPGFVGWRGACESSEATCVLSTADVVAAFEAESTVQWSALLATGGVEIVDAVALPAGGRVLGVRYTDAVSFADDAGTLRESSDGAAAAVVSLDADGRVAWVRAVGDPQTSSVEIVDVGVDPSSGDIAVAVAFHGRLVHGASMLEHQASVEVVDHVRFDGAVVAYRDAASAVLTWDAGGIPGWVHALDLPDDGVATARALFVSPAPAGDGWLIAETAFSRPDQSDVSQLHVVDGAGSVLASTPLNEAQGASLLVRGLAVRGDRALLTVVATGDGAQMPLLGEPARTWDDAFVAIELELSDPAPAMLARSILREATPHVNVPLARVPLTTDAAGNVAMLVDADTRERPTLGRRTLFVAAGPDGALEHQVEVDARLGAVLALDDDGTVLVGATVASPAGSTAVVGRWMPGEDGWAWVEELAVDAASSMGALSVAAGGEVRVSLEVVDGLTLGDEGVDGAAWVEVTLSP